MAGTIGDAQLPVEKLPITSRANAVRVTLPVDVAFDLERMQQATAHVLERLGCPRCHSGWDIRFEIFRDYVVGKDLQVKPTIGSRIFED